MKLSKPIQFQCNILCGYCKKNYPYFIEPTSLNGIQYYHWLYRIKGLACVIGRQAAVPCKASKIRELFKKD